MNIYEKIMLGCIAVSIAYFFVHFNIPQEGTLYWTVETTYLLVSVVFFVTATLNLIVGIKETKAEKKPIF